MSKVLVGLVGAGDIMKMRGVWGLRSMTNLVCNIFKYLEGGRIKEGQGSGGEGSSKTRGES